MICVVINAYLAAASALAGVERQIIVPNMTPVYTNTSSGANIQYIVPAPVPLYLNEQS